jgi:hypothetical protein
MAMLAWDVLSENERAIVVATTLSRAKPDATGRRLGRGDCKTSPANVPRSTKFKPKSTGTNHHGKRTGIVQ